MNDGLTERHWKSVRKALKDIPEIERAVLFGSRAMGTYSPTSDVDMALYGDSLTLQQELRLTSVLNEIDPLIEFDVVRFRTITSPALREHIGKHGVTVYERGEGNEKTDNKMMSEWEKCCWGDIASLEYGKGIRGYENAVGAYYVYGTNGPIGKHDQALCNHASVIIGRKGAYRGIHYSAQPFYVIDTAFYLEPKIALDTRWAYYELLMHDINAMDSGSAIPSTSREAFYNLHVKLPPLPEQRAIARILGTLDDKIENNRKMNETLEAMARAIFKSWFVDFDPVRAKAQGRQPVGMDAETAALFPDGFEDSALGEIPRGWRVGKLEELITIISGGTPKTTVEEYWDGAIPWFTPKDSPPVNQIFVIDTERHITTLGVNESSSQILPPGTTIITARGTVGKLALTAVPMAMNQTCYGICGKENAEYFTYYCLDNLVVDLQQKTHGTVFATITMETFKTITILISTIDLMEAFQRIVDTYMEKIKINLYQSRTLAQIRDMLLPKLLSGEIRIRKQ